MLELTEINAFYGQSHILHDISLQVADGAGVAIIGLNGMGKSTLLKAVMAAGPVVNGKTRLDNTDLAHMQPHQRARLGLALVPEDRRVYAHLTVAENLALAGYVKNEGRNAYTVEAVLEFFPLLQKLANRKGFQLSGGEQQLVAVARAVLSRPRYLLLDEPTEGLSPLITNMMAVEINKIRQREKMALILAEQNIEFARVCTEHVVVLAVGRIGFSGSWAEFDADPAIRQKYFSL